MAKADLPSAEILRKLFKYDPATGSLIWIERDASLFAAGARPAEWKARNWNAKNAGKPAFTANDGHGYKCGAVFGVLSKAHLIAWVIMEGALPSGDIDHINGNRSDNRWENLREVSRSTNLKNAKKKSSNTSGYNGIHWMNDRSLWRASITSNGMARNVGDFPSLEEAVNARMRAQDGLGFTERHGN